MPATLSAQAAKIFAISFRLLRRVAGLFFMASLSIVAVVLRRRVVIIVTPFGNLGNRLFLYANIIAFAIEHRAIVINPAFHPWRAVFAGTRAGGVACYPAPNLPYLPGNWLESTLQHLAWVGLSIASSANSPSQWGAISIDGIERLELDQPNFVEWASKKHVILLSGWLFISSVSMERHADKIRAYFKQILGNTPEALAPVNRLRQTCDLVIGVVIRHGGFDQWMGGKYFFETTKYIEWIKQTARLYPQQRVGFFICSDAELNLESLTDICYEFRGRSDLENRAALSQCDMILSPPSSFAGWAALMGNSPFQLLHSPSQTISRQGFIRIRNHMDMRDASYPPDLDRTDSLIAPRA
ncbi:MAG: hypothetical protein ACK5CQ_01735 [Cyanobacteriota bacterium]